MAKNIPITAKVSKGLFGKKVTEPLLNVGQAGVSGKNTTKNHASPAKMMSSPFKQVNNPASGGDKKEKKSSTVVNKDNTITKVNTSTSVGADIVVPGKEITTKKLQDNYDGSGGYASNDDWTKFLNSPKGKEYIIKNTKEVGTGKFEPNTVVKGETKEERSKFKPGVKDTGDSKRPWERRWDSRAVKKTGKDVRQSENKAIRVNDKMAKLESGFAKDESGKAVAPKAGEKGYKKYAKLQAKSRENASELEGFKGASDMAVMQAQQSAGKGTKIITPERDATRSDYGTVREQMNDLEGEVINNNDATKKSGSKGLSDGIKAGNKKAQETKVTGTLEKAGKAATTVTDALKNKPADTPAEKNANNFFSKKSPLKMKYFK
jgi:hypothetical protein